MKHFFISLLIITLTGITGCGFSREPVPPVTYYTLDYTSPEFNDSWQKLPLIIRLSRFNVAPDNQSYQMLYREGDFTRNEYNYHRWRADPGSMVTYFLARDMNRAGLFEAALSYDSCLKATHGMEGMVESFYEKDERNGWQAVLAVSIILIKMDEPDIAKRVLFQREYKTASPATAKKPGAVAAAMSKAMAGISDKIINDVYKALSEQE